MVPTSFGILYSTQGKPIILSICKNCNSRAVHFNDFWYEHNGDKFTKSEFLEFTCDELIIKGILE